MVLAQIVLFKVELQLYASRMAVSAIDRSMLK
jgi:hypothetical protein